MFLHVVIKAFMSGLKLVFHLFLSQVSVSFPPCIIALFQNLLASQTFQVPQESVVWTLFYDLLTNGNLCLSQCKTSWVKANHKTYRRIVYSVLLQIPKQGTGASGISCSGCSPLGGEYVYMFSETGSVDLLLAVHPHSNHFWYDHSHSFLKQVRH